MDEDRRLPRSVAVVGASGLIGRAVASRLIREGCRVGAVASTSHSRMRLAASELSVVDLEPSDPQEVWARELASFEAVIHAGLPRLSAPVRRRRLKKTIPHAVSVAERLMAALPEGAPLVLASSQFATAARPIARVAATVEQRLSECLRLRVIRVPWVYGETGPLSWITRGLETRRYRVVGPGDNRVPLISAGDAADAMITALHLPPGIYEAGQDSPPTQLDVVKTLCAEGKIPRPDHVPPWLAVFTLGGPLADALAFDLDSPTSPQLVSAGWTPANDWGSDLLGATRLPEGPVEE